MSRTTVTILAFIAFLAAHLSPAYAQDGSKYTDATLLTIVGKGLGTPHPYHRADTSVYDFDPAVNRLLRNSAGLAVAFRTDSRSVGARWTTSERLPGVNMTAISQKGLDLYIREEGRWVFAGAGIPGRSDSHEHTIVKDMDRGMHDCLLYLPCWDELFALEIVTDEGSVMEPLPDPFRHKVTVYGSSIVHGASASRAGMAYPARLSRMSGINFINFGQSGNAKMQPWMAPAVSDTDPDAFILDCFPNPSAAEITERTIPFVTYLSERHPGKPIILVQTIVRETTRFNTSIAKYESDKRDAARKQFVVLVENNIPDIYFIEEDSFLGDDREGTVDGIHPNDLGFDRFLQKVGPKILGILREYGIE